VIIVASVSCIFGLGSPRTTSEMVSGCAGEQTIDRDEMLRRLVDLQYDRNDIDFKRGTFRVRGDVVEVWPAYEEFAYRIELFGDEVDRSTIINPLTGETLPARRSSLHLPGQALRHARGPHRRRSRGDPPELDSG
jgi:excinuclease ABC subunit B